MNPTSSNVALATGNAGVGPLAGLKVIEPGQLIAGLFAAKTQGPKDKGIVSGGDAK